MLRFEHLRADVFELDPLLRRALTGRPAALAPLVVPARAGDLEPPRATLDPGDRAELVERLEGEVAAFEPNVAALDAVRALGEPDTSCVVTRIVPALCGGHQQVLWRALHATALARSLTDRFGTRVVPVVWVDGDAAPLGRGVAWLNEYFDLFDVRMASVPLDGRCASDILLDGDTHRLVSLREQLLQLAPIQSAERVEPLLPRAGDTFASAAVRAWTELLSPLGACVLETEALRDPLQRALGRVASAAEGLDDIAAPIAYRVRNGPRRTLRWREAALRFDDEPGSRTAAEFAAELLQEPSGFCTGEAAHLPAFAQVLPVAAQVGGADELGARWSARQLEARLGRPAPPFVPELRATWLDAPTRASLERLRLDAEAVLELRGRFPKELHESAPVVAELRDIVARASAELLAKRPELAKVDRGLAQQLKRATADVRGAVEKLCVRADRFEANRRGKGRRHERRLAGVLAPHGGPQAEALSALQLVAVHGAEWLEEALASLDPFPTEHALVHLDADEALRQEDP